VSDKERFVGDFDRNEVEIDLSKFMDLLKENSDLKDQIRDLQSEASGNPWAKWVHFAETIDAWRIFPRAFITVYMFLLYYTTMWFMALDAPSLEQSGLISVVVGAGAAWFGLYTRSKGDGDK
jgi:MFS superfamily sulfate permease-like transporter